VERLYREIRPLRIYEGATEVQQLIIARGIIKRFQESELSHGQAKASDISQLTGGRKA
jgi:acyl-CoA dehydrogenase